MASLLRFFTVFLSLCTLETFALDIAGKPNALIKPYKRELLQDIVS